MLWRACLRMGRLYEGLGCMWAAYMNGRDCGDDIFLKLKMDGDVITDGAFIGDGCAISQASADIMLGMVIGRKKDEALAMGEIFMKMIKGEATDEEIDSLEEASALKDIAHMPARVKCAVLGWRTLKEAMGGRE